MSDAIAKQIFRMPMAEYIRNFKRSDMYRHPLFCAGELYDPFDPDNPFTYQGPLPTIEKDWHFSRDSVPEYIKIWVGRAAREKVLEGVQEHYSLPLAERFKFVERDVKCHLYDPHDPETWDTGFFCVIEMPDDYVPNPFGLTYWCGNRSSALTDPQIRPVFLNSNTKVRHGKEAVAYVIHEMAIRKGERL
jgi:hypothetical protein